MLGGAHGDSLRNYNTMLVREPIQSSKPWSWPNCSFQVEGLILISHRLPAETVRSLADEVHRRPDAEGSHRPRDRFGRHR